MAILSFLLFGVSVDLSEQDKPTGTSSRDNNLDETESGHADRELKAEPTADTPPAAFEALYSWIVGSEEDVSYALARRFRASASVPAGLDREAVERGTSHACWSLLKKHAADAVMVSFYREEDAGVGPYSVSQGVLAPDGDWGSADKRAPRSSLKVVVEVRESYFKPQPKPLGVGSRVTLRTKEGDSVSLSRVPDSWGGDDIIVRVRSGTVATILETKKFNLGPSDLIRYRVRTDAGDKGWVHTWSVHPE